MPSSVPASDSPHGAVQRHAVGLEKDESSLRASTSPGCHLRYRPVSRGRSWSGQRIKSPSGARGPSKDETFVTHANVYQLPSGLSREQFLEHVRKGRADEPRTGRFEVVGNDEHLSERRQEVCVEHRAASRDHGATRGYSFTIVDYLGMNCIHPPDSSIGVLVELSRKAPPSLPDPAFDATGAELLHSVEFVKFK